MLGSVPPDDCPPIILCWLACRSWVVSEVAGRMAVPVAAAASVEGETEGDVSIWSWAEAVPWKLSNHSGMAANRTYENL